MELVLHPRAAPSDCVRLWVGAFGTTAVPALRWSLDGVAATPFELRPMASVRSDELLPAQPPPAAQSRTFTGVVEFGGLAPGTSHTVTVTAGGTSAEIRTSTLPARVPANLEGTFNLLLVSCFHQHEDKKGLAGIIVSQLPQPARPHLTLLMGDQVYLDLPTLKDFPKDPIWLARKFEEDYRLNWRGPTGYAQVLAVAPSVSTPDDHEYWNNFPHPSPMIENSWTKLGREGWTQAATATYEGFQRPYPFGPDEPATFEVEPLSFFLPDLRSQRDPDRRFLLTERAHQRLAAWIDQVIARQHFGVFVTGQSLFTEAAGALKSAVADAELPDYDDYGRIMQQLARLADAGLPALCLTGDVHWGRVLQSVDVRSQRTAFYEVISSPSSLVTTVGVDTFKEIGGWFSGLFGKSNPWPRHAKPKSPPDFLASDALAGRFRNDRLHGQRGNHVALLRFARHGGGLVFEVTYWPLSRDSAVAQPVPLPTLQLRIH